MDKKKILNIGLILYVFLLTVFISDVVYDTINILKYWMSLILAGIMLFPFILLSLREQLLIFLLIIIIPFSMIGGYGFIVGHLEKVFIFLALILIVVNKQRIFLIKEQISILILLIYFTLNYIVMGNKQVILPNNIIKLWIFYFMGIIVFFFFSSKGLLKVFYSIGIVSLGNAIYGIIQVLLGIAPENMAIGLSRHHNAFALHSILGFAIWFVFFIYEENKEKRLFFLSAFLIEIVAIILSLSRSVWITLIVFFLFLGIKDIKYRKYVFIAFLILLISLFFMPDFVWNRLDTIINMKNTFSNVYKENELSEVTRFFFALAGIKMFLVKPFFGWGIGQFVVNWMNYSIIYYGFNVSPHNEYVRLLSETGIVGFILWWIAMISFFRFINSMQKRKDIIYDKSNILILQMIRYSVLFIMIVNSMANSMIYNGIFYFYILMSFSILRGNERYEEDLYP